MSCHISYCDGDDSEHSIQRERVKFVCAGLHDENDSNKSVKHGEKSPRPNSFFKYDCGECSNEQRHELHDSGHISDRHIEQCEQEEHGCPEFTDQSNNNVWLSNKSTNSSFGFSGRFDNQDCGHK